MVCGKKVKDSIHGREPFPFTGFPWQGKGWSMLAWFLMMKFVTRDYLASVSYFWRDRHRSLNTSRHSKYSGTRITKKTVMVSAYHATMRCER